MTMSQQQLTSAISNAANAQAATQHLRQQLQQQESTIAYQAQRIGMLEAALMKLAQRVVDLEKRVGLDQ